MKQILVYLDAKSVLFLLDWIKDFNRIFYGRYVFLQHAVDQEDILPLAGLEEVITLKYLQNKFLEKASVKSNQLTFQVSVLVQFTKMFTT